jgi:hypothetical protein
MRATGKHTSTVAAGRPLRRLGVTTAVSAMLLLIAIGAAVMTATPTSPRGTFLRTAEVTRAGDVVKASMKQVSAAQAKAAHALLAAAARGSASGAAASSVPLALTAHDRQACPAAAAACVDLSRHITWLQADGRVSFGPVQMEPGPPGTVHATPRGTFHVQWKAGPDFVSDTYHEAMPWATFFAAGGIAFHGGSLVHWSHGCVHLTVANAHYYNEHLPIGAEVVVF